MFWVAVSTMTNDNLVLLCAIFCVCVCILVYCHIAVGLDCFVLDIFFYFGIIPKNFVEPNGFGYRTIEMNLVFWSHKAA